MPEGMTPVNTTPWNMQHLMAQQAMANGATGGPGMFGWNGMPGNSQPEPAGKHVRVSTVSQ